MSNTNPQQQKQVQVLVWGGLGGLCGTKNSEKATVSSTYMYPFNQAFPKQGLLHGVDVNYKGWLAWPSLS